MPPLGTSAWTVAGLEALATRGAPSALCPLVGAKTTSADPEQWKSHTQGIQPFWGARMISPPLPPKAGALKSLAILTEGLVLRGHNLFC